jgi:hypothetical protein
MDDLSVTLKVIDVLDRLVISYAIGGSVASSAHGLARATNDADLLADIRSENVKDFVEALENEFYVAEESIIDAIESRSSFNLIDYTTGFKIDVFIPKDRDFDRQQLANRVLVVIPTLSDKAYFMSAEDTVLAKLEWYKAGDEISDRQWLDILGVIKLQAGKLNIEYMRDMAKNLGVLNLLDRALKQGTVK